MALAVSYQTVISNTVTSSQALWTSPTAATTPYVRDLVITNSGASLLYVAVGTGATGAAAATGFGIPTGQSILLEGQLPASTKIYGYSPGTAGASIGYASVVSVI